jgi:hypothetical protein
LPASGALRRVTAEGSGHHIVRGCEKISRHPEPRRRRRISRCDAFA